MSTSDFPQPVRIPVNGIELEVFEAGRQNAGTPIVLCHGWPELAYSWRHQVPALVEAGYHVIIPNQRGYGRSSRPSEVTAYDIEQLTGDLAGLLDHYGYRDAVFVGHDWGAFVVWGLALLHPDRVSRLIALSLPYQERGPVPWIEFLDAVLGDDNHLVHFNRHPGVAAAVFEEDPARFLRNLYRKNQPAAEPRPGMPLLELARAEVPLGDPIMSDGELDVFVTAFEDSGFTGTIDWYRNLDRDWRLLADADPIIQQPALMVYGERDTIPRSENLTTFVPRVEVVGLDCGHWIQQELPQETTRLMLDWLARRDEARPVVPTGTVAAFSPDAGEGDAAASRRP